ncbi:MAG: hypothetical protein PHR16_09065 [Methylovulum sp.]|nr:hypothetical protein [Methylovulum sp.]
MGQCGDGAGDNANDGDGEQRLLDASDGLLWEHSAPKPTFSSRYGFQQPNDDNKGPIGATGKEWLLLVVALYFLAAFARQPLSRMILATRCLPAKSLFNIFYERVK